MENYIVSARKYRPATFQSIVGQMHITQTLQSAILTRQLAHAFLFSGPRGVGKTTCARILAKAINCEQLTPEAEPCNQCDSCQNFNGGQSITIHELDAASNNSVDDIRHLIEQTRYVPARTKSGKEQKSVFIVDEVHMLTTAAFNAFLKTLEEPPAHVLFILATTEKHKILPTVLSRCQKFDFRRIKADDMAHHLEYISKQENVKYEFSALQQIALKADGGLRDALSLYDQLVSYSSANITFQIVLENLNILDYDYYFKAVDCIKNQDHVGLILLLNEVVEKGFDARDFWTGLTEHFRNLLMALTPDTVKLLETAENVKSRYLTQSRELPPTILLNCLNICAETDQKLKNASSPRIYIELATFKLAYLTQALQVAVTPTQGGDEKKK
ncbi:MAG: DNA polymerase III subunit gamma/tau [Bacteroidia bacterium]